MWNYNVNSSVDVFLPEPQLTKARQFLSAASVPFEVVIDDMQRAIDEENPSKDQLDLWENRDGKIRETNAP